MAFTLINDRTQAVIAGRLEMATSVGQRFKGLLGRSDLPIETGLLLAPCSAIHTFFMRFSIDVVFLDGDGTAVKVVRRLRPWRMALSLRARAVIELGAGTLGQEQVQLGDRLYVAPILQQMPSEARIPPSPLRGSGEARAC